MVRTFDYDYAELGERMRRKAAANLSSNRFTRPPLKVPAAMARSTAYKRGDVKSNGGLWWVCAGNGTTAGSGGPTNGNVGGPVQDGSCWWNLLGGPSISADDANAPVVSDPPTTSVPSGLNNAYNIWSKPDAYKIHGGYLTQYLATTYATLNGFTAASGVISSINLEVECDVFDDKFALGFPASDAGTSVSNDAMALVVDGQYVDLNAVQLPSISAGQVQWVQFDYSAKDGKKKRNIRLQTTRFKMAFAGIRTTIYGQVSAPSESDVVKAVFIGDSMWAGSLSGSWLLGGHEPNRIGAALGWDVHNLSAGGTGFIATNGGTRYTYGERIAQALALEPDVILFPVSTNDRNSTPAAVAAAALAAMQAIRAGGSRAIIIIIGIQPLDDTALSTKYAEFETSVEGAIATFDDPRDRTFFIPIRNDPVGPWITGSYNNTLLPNSTNSGLYIASTSPDGAADGVHSPDIGSAYRANRIATAIAEQVLPAID